MWGLVGQRTVTALGRTTAAMAATQATAVATSNGPTPTSEERRSIPRRCYGRSSSDRKGVSLCGTAPGGGRHQGCGFRCRHRVQPLPRHGMWTSGDVCERRGGAAARSRGPWLSLRDSRNCRRARAIHAGPSRKAGEQRLHGLCARALAAHDRSGARGWPLRNRSQAGPIRPRWSYSRSALRQYLCRLRGLEPKHHLRSSSRPHPRSRPYRRDHDVVRIPRPDLASECDPERGPHRHDVEGTTRSHRSETCHLAVVRSRDLACHSADSWTWLNV